MINERIFYRFNETHKFSSDEILSIIEHESKLFDEIITESNPDFLIMFEPTLHQEELLYSMCKKRGIKFYLSNNIKLAIKLDLDGAYIPSFNKQIKHLSYSLKKNFDIVGSAHNLKEIRIKERQNVKKIYI